MAGKETRDRKGKGRVLAHMLADALLLLGRLLLLLAVQLLVQLRIRLPQIAQPRLHLRMHPCIIMHSVMYYA